MRRWLAVGLLGLVSWAILASWSPSDDPELSICPSQRILGFSCPGCGFTRAAASLAKGDFRASFRLHPLAGLLAVQAFLIWVGWGFVLRLGKTLPRRFTNLWLLGHALLFLLVWGIRILAGAMPP